MHPTSQGPRAGRALLFLPLLPGPHPKYEPLSWLRQRMVKPDVLDLKAEVQMPGQMEDDRASNFIRFHGEGAVRAQLTELAVEPGFLRTHSCVRSELTV